MPFLSGVERSSGSHGVPADTRDADWTARSLYSCLDKVHVIKPASEQASQQGSQQTSQPAS